MAAVRGSILQNIMRNFNGSITQGAADAFVTVSIETGISTQSNFGILIDSIEWVLDPEVVMLWAPATDIELRVGCKWGDAPTGVGSILLDENTTIAMRGLAIQGVAASTTDVLINSNVVWKAPPNLVVVSPNIHVAMDSTGTGVQNSLRYRIYYTPVEMSEMDVLRFLAS